MGFLQASWVGVVLVCAGAWFFLLRARRRGDVGRQEHDKGEAERAARELRPGARDDEGRG